LIVVDNFSKDKTRSIAKKYCDKLLEKGPERSAQVNYGVENSKGSYIYKVDSDFILEKKVIEECIAKVEKEDCDAVVVHNSPDTRVSWIAKVRKFEVDMYKYDLAHSSARFVKKSIYKKVGGFDSSITAGEDYDFQNKLNRIGAKTGFIDAEALHLGEPTSIVQHMKKYYSYGKDFVNYKNSSTKTESQEQLGFFRSIYFRNWRKFLLHPLMGITFILYHTAKYIAGGLGYMSAKIRSA
jgi:glycosyltransferase involved in cell wall biosynthesis